VSPLEVRIGRAVTVGAICLAIPLCAAQQPFRGRTDLVSVYATVTDHSGHLVTDLGQGDFEVRDNGKVQKIEYFNSDLQPITGVVMLDRSQSMFENFPLVEAGTEEFIRRLLPADKIRLGNFSRRIILSPATFTNQPDELLDILHHRLQSFGPSPVWASIDRSITALLDQTGRRVILIFTDGHDSLAPGQMSTDLKDVARRAVYDEVMIYAIGLWESEPVLMVTRGGMFGQFQVGTPKSKGVKPDAGLRLLADQSGGGYFELGWHDDLAATFARVADELHRQYGLAFAPTKLDGAIHKLEVKVTRPGLIVRTRKSYVAEAR
jgi:Ca-activated chloride channel homolog